MLTITWSPRTTDHFNKLNWATHVHRLVRRIYARKRSVSIGQSAKPVQQSLMRCPASSWTIIYDVRLPLGNRFVLKSYNSA